MAWGGGRVKAHLGIEAAIAWVVVRVAVAGHQLKKSDHAYLPNAMQGSKREIW